jgi:hypothetical protein
MRVATFVLGVSLLIAGVSEGSENRSSPVAHRAAAVLADGMMSAPVSPLVANDRALSPSALQYAREPAARYGFNAMGYVPAQSPAHLLRNTYPNFVESFAPRAEARFDPGRIPLPAARTLEDHLLTGFVAVMLIAYQLRRKHRFLRPHQFSA